MRYSLALHVWFFATTRTRPVELFTHA